ncbi:hypothetical protein ES703_24435 [subsurface metagenome]
MVEKAQTFFLYLKFKTKKPEQYRGQSKMQKIKIKTNKFLKKVECWKCSAFFHEVVLAKYRGVLCEKCYREEYEEVKSIFFDFIASFDVEYDADFEEDLKTLEDVVEMVRDYYEGSCYRLESEEPKEEYKEIVQTAKEIYETLENKNRNKNYNDFVTFHKSFFFIYF